MFVAICDDNSKGRAKLKKLLEAYQKKSRQNFQIDEYDSGLKLCEDKEKLGNYRIIFININMMQLDGLKAAMTIKEIKPEIRIVLVTDCMNDTLDGYRVKATRFLLRDELEHALEACMEDIIKEIRRESHLVQFPFVEGNTALRAEEIIYVETNKHKNTFYTTKETFNIYRKLNDIEKELSGLGFVRIHQSFLVNMRYVEKISSYVMRLSTGQELSVPKSRYQEVKRKYTLYTEGNGRTVP